MDGSTDDLKIEEGQDQVQPNGSPHSEENGITCEVCFQSLSSELQLKSHMILHHQKMEIHQCSFCKHVLSNAQRLKDHERKHTGEKPYPCAYCPKRFGRSVHRLRHERRHRNERPYKCQCCSKAFVTGTELKTHMVTHTGEKQYTCRYCPDKFGLSKHRAVHERLHTGEKPYSCEICNEKFSQMARKLYHKRKVHGENPTAKESVKIHEQLHTEENPYSCDICQEKFTSSAARKYHHQSEHEHRYFCVTCKKGWKSPESLENHQKIGACSRKVSPACHICFKIFTNKRSLVKHLKRIHEKDSSIESIPKCDICSKTFSARNLLISHLRTHDKRDPELDFSVPINDDLKDIYETLMEFKAKESQSILELPDTDEKPFSCDICQENFTSSAERKNHHRLKHEKHTCETCKKSWKCLKKLINHQKKGDCSIKVVHKCEICFKIISSKCHLLRHLRIHDSIKSVPKCDICFKTFPKRSILIRHSQRHEKEKYFCVYCPKRFKSESGLKKHLKIHPAPCPMVKEPCLENKEDDKNLKYESQDPDEKIYSNKAKESPTIHEQLLTDQKPYFCDICQEEFTSSAAREDHHQSKHEENHFCGTCKKSWKCPESLKEHQNMGACVRKVAPECGICFKKFLNKSNLVRHLRRIHEMKNPYDSIKCEIKVVLKFEI